jgi:predicted amidohydrolase
MAGIVRVAGIQMHESHAVGENEAKILGALERARGDGAHFLLTPEGALSGYYAGFDREEVAAATSRLATAAAQAGVGLALGTCYKEVEEGVEFCYNQVRIYTPEGEYLGYHAKILRCSRLAHPGTGEMRDYVEGMLRTFDWQGKRFGALICNDLWATPGWTTMPNPYLPWKLKQLGAQFLLHAVATGQDLRNRPFHESSTELWARTLGLPIFQVNAAPPAGTRTNAPSGLSGADGTRLVTVPDEGEQYFVGEIAVG